MSSVTGVRVCGVLVRRLHVPSLVVACVAMSAMFTASARAEACPNESIRHTEVHAVGLPDCRAYEQVSPVEKNLSNALGHPALVESSPSGNGITFFGLPFPGVAGARLQVQYLGSRSAGGGGEGEWSVQGLEPQIGPESFVAIDGWTEDLSRTIVQVTDAGDTNTYVRDNATGAEQLLAPGEVKLADATADDSQILFESESPTLAAEFPGVAASGKHIPNLYEWNDGQLSVVGVLNSGSAPADGAVAGPGGATLSESAARQSPGSSPGGAGNYFYTQDTMAANGSRVFFSEAEESEEGGKGIIYMREPEAKRTIQISAGTAPAYWRDATPSGSFAFYMEGSSALYHEEEEEEENQELYRYNVGAGTREALTSGAAGVVGTLGFSEDGSYAYFVATGVLASNETNGMKAKAGSDNLYEWHESTGITFIAVLNGASDQSDWKDYYYQSNLKGSRVTPSGESVLITSASKLTSYENRPAGGKCEGASRACYELYLYNAGSGASPGQLTCVSCNPTPGVEVSRSAFLTHNALQTLTASAEHMFLTHNLSDGGTRVFFQTEEALVPRDTNGVTDVYEWEREATGSCERASASFDAASGGCLYLVSTGESSEESYFGDASPDGTNVFFFTGQSLVSQDADDNFDLYDARAGGGIAAQNPSPSLAPCGGEGCRGGPGSAPVFGAPASSTLSGSGNLTPPSGSPPAGSSKPKPKPETRAQKLTRALMQCRTRYRQNKKRRHACEAQARKLYGKTAVRSGRARRTGGRGRS